MKKIKILDITLLAISLITLNSCEKHEENPETQICSIGLSDPISTISKLGMTPTYSGQHTNWTKENITQSINITSQLGVEVVHFGFLWGDIELADDSFDWELSDQVVQTVHQNGQKVSMVSPIPNTYDLDDIPSFVPFNSFDDPILIEQYSSFLKDALERYNDKIHYLWIGNEINGYFEENPDELEEYQTFFESVYDSVKLNFPSIKIGITFTYDGTVASNNISILSAFPKADVLGFSLYPQFLDSNPQNYSNHLQDLITATDLIGKPIAITETTWSSQGFGGSIDNQKLFVKTAVSAFKNSLNNLEFHSFYSTHDFPKSYIEANLFTGEVADWLSSMSFITNEGIPKEAYCTLVDELRSF
ncbi:MAG: glycosyl hydrolase 53 family protein [Candidatus Cyclobacteriaceae bacterium M3_2C_046]